MILLIPFWIGLGLAMIVFTGVIIVEAVKLVKNEKERQKSFLALQNVISDACSIYKDICSQNKVCLHQSNIDLSLLLSLMKNVDFNKIDENIKIEDLQKNIGFEPVMIKCDSEILKDTFERQIIYYIQEEFGTFKNADTEKLLLALYFNSDTVREIIEKSQENIEYEDFSHLEKPVKFYNHSYSIKEPELKRRLK